MDKYDVLFVIDVIKSALQGIKSKADWEKLKIKYRGMKKEWLLMQYYQLRTKRSSEYRKKHGDLPVSGGLQKADFKLDQRGIYAWEMLKPMEEQNNK